MKNAKDNLIACYKNKEYIQKDYVLELINNNTSFVFHDGEIVIMQDEDVAYTMFEEIKDVILR